jgi:hypothetical protein
MKSGGGQSDAAADAVMMLRHQRSSPPHTTGGSTMLSMVSWLFCSGGLCDKRDFPDRPKHPVIFLFTG